MCVLFWQASACKMWTHIKRCTLLFCKNMAFECINLHQNLHPPCYLFNQLNIQELVALKLNWLKIHPLKVCKKLIRWKNNFANSIREVRGAFQTNYKFKKLYLLKLLLLYLPQICNGRGEILVSEVQAANFNWQRLS